MRFFAMNCIAFYADEVEKPGPLQCAHIRDDGTCGFFSNNPPCSDIRLEVIGTCDQCGRIDHHLIDGIGACCRGQK